MFHKLCSRQLLVPKLKVFQFKVNPGCVSQALFKTAVGSKVKSGSIQSKSEMCFTSFVSRASSFSPFLAASNMSSGLLVNRFSYYVYVFCTLSTTNHGFKD